MIQDDILTYEDKTALGVIYEAFQKATKWPTYQFVDRTLEHTYHVEFSNVLAHVPKGWIIGADFRRLDHPVSLSMPALARCSQATGDVLLFMRFLQWAVEVDRSFVPVDSTAVEDIRVTSEHFFLAQLRAGWNLNEQELRRLYEIINTEPRIAGQRNTLPDGWEMILSPEIRWFRDAHTIQDYLELRDRLTPWQEEQAALLENALKPRDLYQILGGSSPAPPSAVDDTGHKEIFVLMPFATQFDPVYAMIQEASGRLELPNLRCYRADEIAKTGRITEQITEAIRAATVIVADLTGNNPNVMFELGYADALGRQIIVLNQDVGASPFDLHDWRQIPYRLNALVAARARLAEFLRNALGG